MQINHSSWVRTYLGLHQLGWKSKRGKSSLRSSRSEHNPCICKRAVQTLPLPSPTANTLSPWHRVRILDCGQHHPPLIHLLTWLCLPPGIDDSDATLMKWSIRTAHTGHKSVSAPWQWVCFPALGLVCNRFCAAEPSRCRWNLDWKPENQCLQTFPLITITNLYQDTHLQSYPWAADPHLWVKTSGHEMFQI